MALVAYALAAPLNAASVSLSPANVSLGMAGLSIGLLLLAVRREAVPQLLGILAMENGALGRHRPGLSAHRLHRRRPDAHGLRGDRLDGGRKPQRAARTG